MIVCIYHPRILIHVMWFFDNFLNSHFHCWIANVRPLKRWSFRPCSVGETSPSAPTSGGIFMQGMASAKETPGLPSGKPTVCY